MLMSNTFKVDLKFLEELEGNSLEPYVPLVGTSGVTIGLGIDLGQTSINDIRRFGTVDGTLLEKVRPFLGRKGDKAARMLEVFRGKIFFTETDVENLNRGCISLLLTRLIELVGGEPAWEKIANDPLRNVAYSLFHVYGYKWKEHNSFKQLMNGDIEGLLKNLDDYGDKSVGTRHKKAAAYLRRELGLDKTIKSIQSIKTSKNAKKNIKPEKKKG